jgi:hypothetical protein
MNPINSPELFSRAGLQPNPCSRQCRPWAAAICSASARVHTAPAPMYRITSGFVDRRRSSSVCCSLHGSNHRRVVSSVSGSEAHMSGAAASV